MGSKYDLSFTFDASDGPLRCVVAWDTALYDDGTIADLAESLQAVLTDAAWYPDRRIGELGLGPTFGRTASAAASA